jgi:hypothetical protein
MKSNQRAVLNKAIIIIVGILLIVIAVIGYRNYKTYQVKDLVKKISKNSSIEIQKLKEVEYDMGLRTVEAKMILKDEVSQLLIKVQKLPFTYHLSIKEFARYGYTVDEAVTIYINMDTKIVIQKKNDKNRYFMLVYSDIKHKLSDVYRLDSSEGSILFDWLMEL